MTRPPGQTKAQTLSRAALRPSINCASVIEAYQGNLMGADVDLGELVNGLSESCKGVKDGDLSTVEAMLVGQATALQTIFSSLARRAATQEHLRQYETFMGLALKAQAQSRATISALVDLKYPRQATFVKQANIAHGPQQVNNGAEVDQFTHAKQTQPKQNELLEEAQHGSTHLDTSATAKATRSHQAVEAVATVQRAKKSRG
ncbi:hypothetical protein [Polaromonas glacialis]|uniref:hypothetical protein n=1 Tax=Polaromonas glacialis TaxID=866564 RepID=UPI0012EC1F8C|nr:hypothetical protein [Polaromonas glacialis]